MGSFQISRYEVSFDEWSAVCGWAVAHGYDLGGTGKGTGGNHPVQSVTLVEVIKWCNAKSEKEGLQPVYTVYGAVYRTGASLCFMDTAANGYSLPIEAEWEWAARGGVESRGYIYSGSNNLDDVGWYGYIPGYNQPMDCTYPCGTKSPNELGVYDMSGNVSEWCYDQNSLSRYITWHYRGGSSESHTSECAVATRDWMGLRADTKNGSLGFRVIRRVFQ